MPVVKKKLLLIHIELYKREFIPKLYLALKLAKESGWQVLMGSVETFAQENSLDKAVYLNKDHGVWSESRLLKIKSNGYIVTAFDEEGLIYKSDEVYNSSRGSAVLLDNLDAVFLWGSKQLETIQKKSKETSNKYVSGSPKFDLYQMLSSKSEDWSSRRRKSDKIKVLLNTRFTYVNYLRGSLSEEVENLKRLGFIKDDFEEKEFLKFVESDRIIYNEFMKFIDAVGNSKGIELVIRPHPAENKDPYTKKAVEYKNVNVDNESDLIDQILGSDCVVHDGCTTAIEAKALGKHVFGLRPLGLKAPYDGFANKFSVNFSSCSDLYNFIIGSEEWADSLQCNSQIKDYIDNWGESSSIFKISDVFNSLAAREFSSLVSYKNRFLKASLKRMAFSLLTKWQNSFGGRFDYFPSWLDAKILAIKRADENFPLMDVCDVQKKINYLANIDDNLGSDKYYSVTKMGPKSILIEAK